MHKPVSVAWRDRPFDGTFRHVLIERENGSMPTIAKILANLQDLPRGFREIDGQVRINGELVPRHRWELVKPGGRGVTDVCVTLHMPLRDSGAGRSSGKQTAALVATIAVLLVAAAVTGGAAGGLIPILAAGAGWGASVAGAAIGIGGALLISALFKPPSLSVANTQQKAPSAAADLTASLQGNALSPGSAVPRVIGTVRLYPPLLSPPLTELVGKNLYAEAVYGLAGPHMLQDIQSDGVNIDDVSFRNEVTLETQEGLSNITQSLVTRQGYTDQLNLTLSQAQLKTPGGSGQIYDPTLAITDAVPQWHSLVTRDSPDEFWISLGFPEGLGHPGSTNDYVMAFRIRLRLQGTSAWTNCPELHVARDNNLVGSFEKEIRLKWGTSPAVPATPPDSSATPDGWIFAYKTVPVQQEPPAGIGGWTSDPSFSLGSGSDLLNSANPTGAGSNVTNVELFVDRAIVYLDPTVFPQGIYEVQIIRSWSYAKQNFTPATYVYNANNDNVTDFFQYVTIGAQNLILQTVSGVYDQAVVGRTASVWLQNPIQSGDFATISVRVTGRALGQLSVLASGYVPDWDGTGWYNVVTTSNPAPHFRDVLCGTLGGCPLPPEIVDDAGLVEWRGACENLGYECNAVIEGKTYIDVLNLIAACGYATLRASETWGIVRDRDRSAESPIQLFTPRNMDKFSWTKAFTQQPTGFRVSYLNSDLQYIQDEEIVFADDVNQNADFLESITYDGLVTRDEIIARALHDLGQGAARLTFYSGVVELDGYVCQRGDLVAVQHDILSDGAGWARIKSVQISNNLVTGLTFEGTAEVDTSSGLFQTPHIFASTGIFELGSRTGVLIRLHGGGGVLTKEITAESSGDALSVTFVRPFPDPGRYQLDADCLCAVGPLGEETRRLLVYDIDPKPADFTATLTFIDEAPELWGGGLLTLEDGEFITTDDDVRIGIVA